jgi:hypothetical protein
VRVGSVEVRDEVGGSSHATVCRRAEVASRARVAECVCDSSQRVEGEDLHRGVVRSAGMLEDRVEAVFGTRQVIGGVHSRQQALAERGLLSAAGLAVPGCRRFESGSRRCDLSERTLNPTQVYPGERGQPGVAGVLGFVDRELESG